MFITALFTKANLRNQPRCPTLDEWINNMWYIYTMWCIYTMEFQSAMRSNGMWFEGKWMQLVDIMLSEEIQAHKYEGICFSHMWKID
jgi:hypothetical protein